MENDYSKREIDHFVEDIQGKLDLILKQTTLHNGRLTRMERISLIFATALLVLLVTNGSELTQIFKLLI